MTDNLITQPEGDPSENVAYASHQKWGGTYLVVADDSEEFEVALRYAAQMANANKCRIGIFYAIEDTLSFRQWGNVEARIRHDQRKHAEEVLLRACVKLDDYTDIRPALYIEDGARKDALTRVIDNDEMISMLLLCGGTQGGGPGPLVKYFTGKGLAHMRVPVIIVPDHIDYS